MSSSKFIFRLFSSVLIVTNVLGNSLVIVVILKSRFMKTPINYLLLNLALADLIVGVFLAPPLILYKTITHPQGITGDVLCKFISTGNLAWTSTYVSVFSLVLIAYERYYAIMKPLSIRHRITTRKLKTFIAISWTIAIIRMVPFFYFEYFDEQLKICNYAWPTWYPNFSYALFLLFFLILPTSIMAVLYSRVIHRLWFKHNGANNGTSQAVRQSRKKVTKSMLTLSAIYVLCYWPDAVMHILELSSLISSYSQQIHDAFNLLIVLNSTVNPIAYAFQFEEFRKGTRKLICCKGRRINVTPCHPKHNVTETRRVDLKMTPRET